jgi:regulator of sigma E protease
MAQILTYLYVVAAVLLMFGAAIFVHEYGHYWMARRRGLKIEGFAIGFGPKMFSWVARDGVEWSVRWIPAGGFVKLPQMVTSETIEGEHKGEPLPPVSPWSKILVAFAGPFMNVVFAFAIATVIWIVGLPVPVNPSIIGYVDPQSEEYKLGIREGDRIISVNGKLARSWQDVQTITVLARTNVLPVVIERDGVRQTYQLTASPNPVLGLKMLNLDPRDHPIVAKVEPGFPAAAAGLKENDKFVSFAGVPIVSQEQLVETISKLPGKPSEVEVERGSEKLKLTVTPRLDPATGKGRIGVHLTTSSAIVYQVQRPGPDPWTQIVDVWDQTINTLAALLYSRQTGVGAKDLSGPVGILSMLAIQVKTDYRLALKFLVLLNVNLAILNLLPVPVLDGGHILMAIIEKIRRRPLSVKFVEWTTTAFAVLLISFMLYVTFFDIKRFSLFKNMFQREAQIEQGERPPPSLVPAPEPAHPVAK